MSIGGNKKKKKNKKLFIKLMILPPKGSVSSVQRAQTKKKRRNVLLLFFYANQKCHIISQSLFSSFISIPFFFFFFFKLQQGVLHKLQQDRTSQFSFFFLFPFFNLQVQISSLFSTIFFYFRCYPPYSSSPTSKKSITSHACFEARSNKHHQEEKNIQNVLTNIKIIYIYLYI